MVILGKICSHMINGSESKPQESVHILQLLTECCYSTVQTTTTFTHLYCTWICIHLVLLELSTLSTPVPVLILFDYDVLVIILFYQVIAE